MRGRKRRQVQRREQWPACTFHKPRRKTTVAILAESPRVPVAQISNLLYRRLLVGRVSEPSRTLAGWKPAIRQIGNLRYGLGQPIAPQQCELILSPQPHPSLPSVGNSI